MTNDVSSNEVLDGFRRDIEQRFSLYPLDEIFSHHKYVFPLSDNCWKRFEQVDVPQVEGLCSENKDHLVWRYTKDLTIEEKEEECFIVSDFRTTLHSGYKQKERFHTDRRVHKFQHRFANLCE
jgi:hypothetical protein